MLKPSPSFTLQHFRPLHLSSVASKKAIFKPKIARTRPIKTPSTLALENFDFYYSPLYGDQWPSVRLGLLTPNKFVAVHNRFSMDSEVNEHILESLGTKNVMDYLIGAKKEVNSLKLEQKKAKVAAKPLHDLEGDEWTEEEAFGQKKATEAAENEV